MTDKSIEKNSLLKIWLSRKKKENKEKSKIKKLTFPK